MATIFSNISPNGENRRLMLIDSWVEDPDSVEMMDNPVDGDKVAVRSHNSENEIVVDSVKVYDNGSWTDDGGGGAKFIVPEQTITIVDSAVSAVADFSGVSEDKAVIIGRVVDDGEEVYIEYTTGYCIVSPSPGIHIEYPEVGSYGVTVTISEEDGVVEAYAFDSKTSDVAPGTYTFAVMDGFVS